ncbi:hypothetical protein LOK49_LG12G02237 [Camellia lanceoleosa]|uniref:Uncharacterized protein n=1 Tax=Camellia lanceoleosa TaxID=1840588 RepID=A0ACC0FPI6_9ERIC|nr:hypothetical protein LOK49_LG12G02237 [Camellia lanceoleosa]
MATEDKSKDLASSKGSNKTDSEVKGKSKDKKKKKKQSTDSLVENMEQCNFALEDMHNISLEEKKPKTVNAFQRVKIDAVEFANERLQNNSYWAKDSAEVGYGAKAQEILRQVKGRYVFDTE